MVTFEDVSVNVELSVEDTMECLQNEIGSSGILDMIRESDDEALADYVRGHQIGDNFGHNAFEALDGLLDRVNPAGQSEDSMDSGLVEKMLDVGAQYAQLLSPEDCDRVMTHMLQYIPAENMANFIMTRLSGPAIAKLFDLVVTVRTRNEVELEKHNSGIINSGSPTS